MIIRYTRAKALNELWHLCQKYELDFDNTLKDLVLQWSWTNDDGTGDQFENVLANALQRFWPPEDTILVTP